MDTLKRTLVEKAGHDFGFEYAVNEAPTTLTLGSSRHPIRFEITFANDYYNMQIINAEALLINELRQDFPIIANTITCSSIERLATVFKRTAALALSLPNQVEHNFELALAAELDKFPGNIKNTEVERVVRKRVGQEMYRKAMLEYWGGACAVTGVAIPEILRASHILSWAECETDGQRLDVFNGLLLTANLDALFDSFLISFDKMGFMIISDLISENERTLLGLSTNMQLRRFMGQHEAYLKTHRARLHVIQT